MSELNKMKTWTVTLLKQEDSISRSLWFITSQRKKERAHQALQHFLEVTSSLIFHLSFFAGSSELEKEGEKESFARRVTEPVPSPQLSV